MSHENLGRMTADLERRGWVDVDSRYPRPLFTSIRTHDPVSDLFLTGTYWGDRRLVERISGLESYYTNWYSHLFQKQGWSTFMFDTLFGDWAYLGTEHRPDDREFTDACFLVAPWPMPKGPDGWMTVHNGNGWFREPYGKNMGPLVAPELAATYGHPNVLVRKGNLILWSRLTERPNVGDHYLTADIEAAWMPLAERLWHLLTGR